MLAIGRNMNQLARAENAGLSRTRAGGSAVIEALRTAVMLHAEGVAAVMAAIRQSMAREMKPLLTQQREELGRQLLQGSKPSQKAERNIFPIRDFMRSFLMYISDRNLTTS